MGRGGISLLLLGFGYILGLVRVVEIMGKGRKEGRKEGFIKLIMMN